MLAERIKQATDEAGGLVSKFHEHARRPLVEHLADFRRHLEAKGSSPKHVAKITGYVERVLADCKFRYIAELNADRAAEYLHDRRQPSHLTHVSPSQIARATGKKITRGGQAKMPRPCIAATRGQPARWE